LISVYGILMSWDIDLSYTGYWSLYIFLCIWYRVKRHTISDNHCIVKRFCIIYVWYTVPVSVRYRMSDIAWYRVKRPFWCRSLSLIQKKAFLIQRLTLYILYQQGLSLHQTKTSISERPFRSISKGPADTECVWCSLIWEVGGWGRDPFSRNFMKPTPRRKWYLTTGRRFHKWYSTPSPNVSPYIFLGLDPSPPPLTTRSQLHSHPNILNHMYIRVHFWFIFAA